MSAVDVITFGCRLNASESDVIRLRARDAADGDLVVVNTCAVTAEAERQARQAIRRARRDNANARIVVTGCAAEINPKSYAAMAEVDGVIGNAHKFDAAAYADPDRAAAGDIMAQTRLKPAPLAAAAKVRAFVQIQNGCDHRCTFCIIPFGRGNSRSLPADEAVAAVAGRVAQGHREVVLTGVDITAYGHDLGEGMNLGRLVKRILGEVDGLERLRLSSLDSVEVDDDLIEALAGDERLMPHLHLSLQAGHDLILKRMKRRHSRAQAIAFCRQVRQLRPDVVFGADLIAGFPTEDEAMFQASLDLVAECGLTWLHVFPFSARPGTPAARMPQVAGAVVRERAQRLRQAGAARARAFLADQVGWRRKVLMETAEQGRSEHNARVRLAGEASPGEIVAATICAVEGEQLIGRV